LCCDLGHINSILNQNSAFLDLIFSKASTDIAVEICESPLLGLDRHHRAYELMVDVRLCEFEAMIMDKRRFRFRAADCEAITEELSLVDWYGIFSRKGVDLCVDRFYDVIWSCFEKFVPRTSTRCAQKLAWVTKKLNGLKNKTTKAAKRMKESKRRCMVDDDINECDCAKLQGDFTALRSTYHRRRHGLAYDDNRIGIEEEIKTDPKSFSEKTCCLSICHDF
jgi:hypothetical protein